MKKSTRALGAWDSGSVIAPVMETLMQAQAGIQYPVFTWKKHLPQRRKMALALVFNFGSDEGMEEGQEITF